MHPCNTNVMQTSVWLLFICVIVSQAKVQYKVKCKDDYMLVDLKRTNDITHVYLDGLKFYPDPACQPHVDGNQVTIMLSLDNVFQCGVTRVINQLTGVRTFYHRIVIEEEGESSKKEFVSVKCILGSTNHNHTLSKRNVLPAGFQEPEDLEITTSYTGKAPQPQLQVGVRQSGNLVTGELNVNPGTPLQMEIFLDKDSAPIYGLLVSYMQVTDTKTQEETIIFNGCSVDSYLFENFNTVDGDFLTAKFRAFKFPESTYVQFKGTVNVCLDKCRGPQLQVGVRQSGNLVTGELNVIPVSPLQMEIFLDRDSAPIYGLLVECSNGQIGYGRRKREVRSMPPDPNKVFEITITSFIKVNYKGDSLLEKVQLDTGSDQSTTVLPNEGKNDMTNNENLQQHLKLDTEEIREDLMYTIIEEKHSSAVSELISLPTILLTVLLTLIHNFQQ